VCAQLYDSSWATGRAKSQTASALTVRAPDANQAPEACWAKSGCYIKRQAFSKNAASTKHKKPVTWPPGHCLRQCTLFHSTQTFIHPTSVPQKHTPAAQVHAAASRPGTTEARDHLLTYTRESDLSHSSRLRSCTGQPNQRLLLLLPKTLSASESCRPARLQVPP